MGFFQNIKIPNKLFLGFGSILMLLLLISAVSISSLLNADSNFKEYRSLARQTNADGRVQANMLLTRIFAKNFVIQSNAKNIDGVKKRAKKTIEMIAEARELSNRDGYQLVIDGLDSALRNYVAQFERVTEFQADRDKLVHGTLNVIGPGMEKTLTTIMESAFSDNDTEAAYRAGLTLRNLLLARLYAARFLIQNDDASYQRVRQEFKSMIDHQSQLLDNLDNPRRKTLAEKLKSDQRIYADAFANVHNIINSRNNIITRQLDRIGPEVADQVEKLKLAIKFDQDTLGPRAEAEVNWAVILTVSVSIIATLIAIVLAWIVGISISNPIKLMTSAMKGVSSGNLETDIVGTKRGDEVGEIAKAVEIFKQNAIEKNRTDAALHDAFGIITDSIKYASRIQRSVLPEPRFLHLRLTDHFVLWEPRDVVGGDIYGCMPWGNGTLVVVIDCTGHGVPGAFMTLISMGALERALPGLAEGNVGELIQNMHQIVQATLNQEHEGGDSDDGLELGACYINDDKNQLKFSGARFDLFTASNGEITVNKGTNALVGYRGIPHDQKFETVEIDVEDGASFYMSSDGLTDQIGGPRGRMFGKKRLVGLLSNVHGQRMDDQKDKIQNAMIEYQGEQLRRDDVTMIGFRI